MRGFTLIELMVVIVIIGLLAAIAIPAYRNYLVASRRSEVQAAMSGLATAMERYAGVNNTFVGATVAGLGFRSTVPQNGTNPYYTITLPVANITATSYLIVATRAGVQGGDACGDYTLTEAGKRGNINVPGTLPTDCWGGS